MVKIVRAWQGVTVRHSTSAKRIMRRIELLCFIGLTHGTVYFFQFQVRFFVCGVCHNLLLLRSAIHEDGALFCFKLFGYVIAIAPFTDVYVPLAAKSKQVTEQLNDPLAL